MKADIKQIHTIAEQNIQTFNKYLSDICKDMQRDGLEVEIQYSYDSNYSNGTVFTALIIGRGK